MSEFDKWWEENCMILSSDRTEAEDIYNLGVESQQAKIDNLQKENDRLNTWYKNVKLQLENKQIDCDRSDRDVDELQKKYDAMYNAFIVADDCRKDWHESYIGVRKECDELRARVDEAMKYVSESPLKDVSRRAMIIFMDILKGNKDEN